MTAMKWLGLTLLTVSSFTCLIVCPHSKLEESFNLQATHNLYYHGITPALKSVFPPSWFLNSILSVDAVNDEAGASVVSEESVTVDISNGGTVSSDGMQVYDHVSYPGVVPRTFSGPIVVVSILSFVTLLTKPLVGLSKYPLFIQGLSSVILLLFNLHTLFRMSVSIERRFPSRVRGSFLSDGYFLLITGCQFHLPYYSSRMLPNIFALGIVTHAYAYWLHNRPHARPSSAATCSCSSPR